MGTLLAAAGLAVIGFHIDATITALGVALVVGAALGWAVANIIVKRAAWDAVAWQAVGNTLFGYAAMVLGGIALITLAGRRRS